MDKAAGGDKLKSGRIEARESGNAQRDGQLGEREEEAEEAEEAQAPKPAESGLSNPGPDPLLVRPPATPPLRLLDALRERLRYMHYSLRTEEAYVYWARGFVRWAGLRHPRDLGAAEVQDFLVMLANERRVAAATHRQALSALLFLYREVLAVDMPWLASSAARCRISAFRWC